MFIEVSVAEVLDRLSILEIKKERIKDPSKLSHIQNEYDMLADTLNKEGVPYVLEYDDLKSINSRIWDAEEEIRKCSREPYKEACDILEISHLAETIHTLNDERAKLKKTINLAYDEGRIVEQKSYEGM